MVKEVSITKYGSDKELPPTFMPWEVYQYSDTMLKHLPKDNLKHCKNIYSIQKKKYTMLAQDMTEEISMVVFQLAQQH